MRVRWWRSAKRMDWIHPQNYPLLREGDPINGTTSLAKINSCLLHLLQVSPVPVSSSFFYYQFFFYQFEFLIHFGGVCYLQGLSRRLLLVSGNIDYV